MRFTIFLLLLMLSCDDTSNNANSDEQCNVHHMLNKKPIPCLNLYDIVDSVCYIPLQTSDSCLLRQVTDVIYHYNHYIVKDNGELFSFDQRGKFVSKIGRMGRGAEEYIYITAYCVNITRGTIYLLCGSTGRLLEYDLLGNYIGVSYMRYEHCNIRNLIQLPTGDFLAHYPLDNDLRGSKYEYQLFRRKGDSLCSEPLIQSSKYMVTHGMQGSLVWKPFVKWQGHNYAIRVLSHCLYRWNNETLEPLLSFEFGKSIPSVDFFETNKNLDVDALIALIEQKSESYGFTYLKSADHYLFLKNNYSGRVVMYDGERAVLLSGRVYDPDRNLYTDIMNIGFSDSSIGQYSASLLYAQRQDTITYINKDLECIVDTIAEDSNPVLIRTYLKSNLVDDLLIKYSDYFIENDLE